MAALRVSTTARNGKRHAMQRLEIRTRIVLLVVVEVKRWEHCDCTSSAAIGGVATPCSRSPRSNDHALLATANIPATLGI
jgi:hypothetical protein